MTLKFPKILLAYIVAWMFFFPVSFTFLPAGINSKMLVAVLGIVIFITKLRRGETSFTVRPQLVVMTLLAILFSIECYFSVTYNNTQDMDYTTYVVSMAVWLGAAYAAYSLIDNAHEDVGVDTICKYVVALCLGQVIVALMMTLSPGFFKFLSNFFVVFENRNTWESRLYGLGTSSDTGGIRFALALISLGFLLARQGNTRREYYIYYLSFVLIFAIGSMMSRTTSIGALIALLYIVAHRIFSSVRYGEGIKFSGTLVFLSSVAVVGGAAYLAYQLSPVIRELIQFGFEGFFNYAESGEFSTHSSDNLTDMWSVWPDNFKTWMIGDGLFLDPSDRTKFYMRTDVGYARLIFYCGIIGVILFASFLIYTALSCAKRHQDSAKLFMLILFFQLIVWIKVSTDIFFIFAFFFFVEPKENNPELISGEGESLI